MVSGSDKSTSNVRLEERTSFLCNGPRPTMLNHIEAEVTNNVILPLSVSPSFPLF